MSKLSFYGIIIAFFIFCSDVYALSFDKPITASVVVSPSGATLSSENFKAHLANKKYVTLMNIRLTPQQKQALLHYADNTTTSVKSELGRGLPKQAEVGMNGVPVLDQGPHGSCVTFANTAALDALLGKGDYISQLCNLALGRYFEEKGYLPSGWDGSIGPLVLHQISGFGIINKDRQRAHSCGNLYDYPLTNPHNEGNAMPLDEFKLLSENLNEHFYWKSLLTIYERFEWSPAITPIYVSALLLKIKTILASKSFFQDSRLSFAVVLPFNYCSAGACARYHVDEDTWALTRTILNDKNPTLGGHEMIITGYNDDAIAIDHDGKKHQGLLTLRNSWGSNAGDHGNYYMSYDFFKQFVVEVQQIVMLKE